MNLAGRSVLLTGASGGIGHAIARRLGRAGASLILTGRRKDRLEPLATELGGRAEAVDLCDAAAVERLAAECADVDILVANAGLPGSGPLLDYGIDEIDRVLAVNLRTPMVLSRLLGERMVARGSGHIVLVSSLSGKFASEGSAVYSATKFGLRGFGQALRGDLHGTGVGVSVVFPGFIRDAGMFHEADVHLPRTVGTSTPDEVAEGVVEAIERDRGEVDVAPFGMRLGAALGGVAPTTAAALSRRLGGAKIAADLGEGQRQRRS
jgi:short-subunit dehydrogenase